MSSRGNIICLGLEKKQTARLFATLKKHLKKAFRLSLATRLQSALTVTDQRLAIGKGQRQQGLSFSWRKPDVMNTRAREGQE